MPPNVTGHLSGGLSRVLCCLGGMGFNVGTRQPRRDTIAAASSSSEYLHPAPERGAPVEVIPRSATGVAFRSSDAAAM